MTTCGGLVVALALAASLAPCLASCARRVHPDDPVLVFDGDPRAAWARVLERSVDEEGRIDLEGLRADPSELERFVAWIGTTSPASEPERFTGYGEALVYWIEAYDALAMYSVVVKDSRPVDLNRFFYANRFLVGGEWMSLETLREEHLMPLGDERVLFALSDLSRGAPRLWREPLVPRRIDVQLDARAREFLTSDRNVLVRYDIGTVYLSRLLVWSAPWILTADASFVAYVNRYRRSQLLPRTFVRWLDYDWSLNAQ